MVTDTDLRLKDGRTLHVYDTGADGERLPVFWHHGTPNTGAPPEPLFGAADRLGIRWLGYDRPAYGTSTPRPGRDVASAAMDVASIADALGIDRFAVMGHSGGGPRALACAALLPERVQAVVAISGMAPFGAPGLDWFAGIGPAGVARLRAAQAGREALERHLAVEEFDPEQFTAEDFDALRGDWAWLGRIAGEAIEQGPAGMTDDELAAVAPWGFDPALVAPPVLIVHGGRDRMVPCTHGEWLAARVPVSELWIRPEDGHISVLSSAEAAMDWLREHSVS